MRRVHIRISEQAASISMEVTKRCESRSPVTESPPSYHDRCAQLDRHARCSCRPCHHIHGFEKAESCLGVRLLIIHAAQRVNGEETKEATSVMLTMTMSSFVQVRQGGGSKVSAWSSQRYADSCDFLEVQCVMSQPMFRGQRVLRRLVIHGRRTVHVR